MYTLIAYKAKKRINLTTDKFKEILQMQRILLLDHWEITIYENKKIGE